MSLYSNLLAFSQLRPCWDIINTASVHCAGGCTCSHRGLIKKQGIGFPCVGSELNMHDLISILCFVHRDTEAVLNISLIFP